MKSFYITVLTILLTMATTAHGANMDTILQQLDLAPDQEETVKTIITNALKERVLIVRDAGLERGKRPDLKTLRQLRKNLKTARERSNTALSSVLNKQQMDIWLEFAEESRQNMIKKFREGKQAAATNE